MILHASLTVAAPRPAAEALALLMGGEAHPYPEFGEAWLAMAGDAHGTLVELLERGTEFHYAPGRAVEHRRGPDARQSGCHILIETPHDETRVLAIAEQYRCRAHRTRHGPLDIIEFWIEDRVLVEVATPSMATAYRRLATLATVRTMAAASAG
jgi:hypothetical protein